MGTKDAAEMLEVAKAEYARLEAVNTELQGALDASSGEGVAAAKYWRELQEARAELTAVQQPNRDALRRAIEGTEVWRVFGFNIEPVLDAVLAALAVPTEPRQIDREAMLVFVGQQLGDALLCSRVWEAWGYGTMTQDDFAQAAEDDDFVAEFTDALIAHLSAIPATGEVETREFLSITEQKSSVWWEYGVEREQATAMSSREAAEREIERQRTRKGGYRIMGQRLVRRLVSAWEVTP